MKILELLNEMTYDDIDSITRKIGQRLNKELKDKEKAKIEITDLIPTKYRLPEKKAYVKYIKKGPPENYVETIGKNVIFTIKWPVSFEEQWTTKGKIVPTLRTLKHELVHVLDYMRDKEIDDVKYTDTKDSVSYYMDDYEFNTMINSIKEYKRLQPKSWNTISSLDKIFTIIQVHGFGAINVDDKLKNNKEFKDKLIARLKSEKLIPPSLKL